MKRFRDFIIEKLKVSKNYFSDITLESLIKALNDYKDRKHYEYALYIDLNAIFKEYPVVLQYHGTYKDQNIVGEKMKGIQLITYNITYNNPSFRGIMKDGKDGIFIHFVSIKGVSLKIENTEELYDIFGEEAVNKIYDYIIKQ